MKTNLGDVIQQAAYQNCYGKMYLSVQDVITVQRCSWRMAKHISREYSSVVRQMRKGAKLFWLRKDNMYHIGSTSGKVVENMVASIILKLLDLHWEREEWLEVALLV